MPAARAHLLYIGDGPERRAGSVPKENQHQFQLRLVFPPVRTEPAARFGQGSPPAVHVVREDAQEPRARPQTHAQKGIPTRGEDGQGLRRCASSAALGTRPLLEGSSNRFSAATPSLAASCNLRVFLGLGAAFEKKESLLAILLGRDAPWEMRFPEASVFWRRSRLRTAIPRGQWGTMGWCVQLEPVTC